jgi:hypothetical protein
MWNYCFAFVPPNIVFFVLQYNVNGHVLLSPPQTKTAVLANRPKNSTIRSDHFAILLTKPRTSTAADWPGRKFGM